MCRDLIEQVLLQAALDLMALGERLAGSPVSPDKLSECVDVILSYQNSCGGWATYENKRSTTLLEVHFLWMPCIVSKTLANPV